jgi:hypothetical protein
MNNTLLVNRKNFQDTELVSQEEGPLEDGYVRVDIGPFALTANNITYMVVGDQIGYWKFFDPNAYGMDAPDQGRMPVWGYGKVTQSNCSEIAVGARLYGFFPIAQRMDIKPVKISPLGFQDGAPHRLGLHPIYNSYVLTDNDPGFVPELDDLQPILRPLFTTSFLIDDFFALENFFGAKQIILLSASSKTALGTAFCLKQREGIHVVGLTSKGNVEFTQSTDCYDEVCSYDDFSALDKDVPTAIIDMAGNGDINATLYEAFGEHLVYNCMVGKSHWQGAKPPKITKGAPPVMFFAPDRAKQRISDWGGAGFAQNLAALWLPFCQMSQNWLDISHEHGEAGLLTYYNELLDGQTDPAKGKLFTL